MNSIVGSPVRAWLTVALLWFVAFFNYLARVMITTMHGSITTEIPMTEMQFGLLTSVFLWVYALLSPAAGFMADRFSRSRVIIVSMLSWSAVTWLTGYATTFRELLIMRAVMGVCEACYIPAALALIADYHRNTTRSFAISLHVTGVSAGAALAGMAGWLAEKHTWNFPFTVVGLAGIAYSVVLLFALRDAPREGVNDGATDTALPKVQFLSAVKSLVSRGSFLLLLAYWMLVSISAWILTGWLPVYLQQHFRLEQGEAGLSATSYYNVASLVGVVIGGIWSDRWSRTHERSRIWVTVIGLCVATPSIIMATQTDLLAFALVCVALFGFSNSFGDSNVMPILCFVSDPRFRATGFGILNLFACLAGGIAIAGAGALQDAGIDLGTTIAYSAISLLVCAALLLAIKPGQPGQRP